MPTEGYLIRTCTSQRPIRTRIQGFPVLWSYEVRLHFAGCGPPSWPYGASLILDRLLVVHSTRRRGILHDRPAGHRAGIIS